MSLTVTAPAGAHFEPVEVKTARGSQSLGEVPLLVWDDLDACVNQYGIDALIDVLDGTSFRVSFQGIARRLKAGGKSDDEIAQAQLDFRPGKRVVGASTPQSRAKKAASAAAEKVGGDTIARMLERIANGEISAADAEALAG